MIEQTDKLKIRENELKESVNKIKELTGNLTMTNEEFLVFLGNSAKKNNVTVSEFNDLGARRENDIVRMVFDFELKGSISNINKVLEDINGMGIKFSCGSISYRQNEKYDYLKRFFDDMTNLPWYKEPEDKEESENGKDEESEKEEEKELPEPNIIIPEVLPEPEPYAEPPAPEKKDVAPEITEPLPKENSEPKSIDDRLNDLLKRTRRSGAGYQFLYLRSTDSDYTTIDKTEQEMRLSVTICFIMFNSPSAAQNNGSVM